MLNKGFIIGKRHRKLIKFRLDELKKNAQTSSIFLENNKVPNEKLVLRQTDLANTLRLLAENGRKGFYAGIIAEKLIKSVRENGGIWTQTDFDNYQVVEREPVRGQYKGIDITSAALPSSGGIVLIEALNILSEYKLEQLDDISRKHIIVEAMRRAYHDRAFYLGDSDFVDVPIKRLINQHYAAGLRSSIRIDKSSPSHILSGNIERKTEGRDTTHFSIMDKNGNRVGSDIKYQLSFWIRCCC